MSLRTPPQARKPSPQGTLDGFKRHYELFRNCARLAKNYFEAGNWLAIGHLSAIASTSTTVGLLTDDEVRADLLKRHAGLLEVTWSQTTQATLARGELPEVLSYPETLRFAH